ncbi:hypothetical protein DFH09DRAFT_239301 [Mycena vulgaris]|nr:hypothetical protein DFH09DRAFT_239301 [Mycena vulgaris]
MSEAYLTDYENHLGQLKAHLLGSTGQPLPPSFIQPAGYWTSREKDHFFHALAVHSRLRPDLIAESVKSKNVLDVCAYIDALDAAARLHTSSLRSTLECAMEVSDTWVQYEEEQASALAKLEPGWERAAEEHRRAMLLASRFQDDHPYWSWKEQQERQWARQDGLAQLSIPHFRIMDRLIRKAREDEPPLIPPPDNGPPLTHPSTSRLDAGLIDPVLLALSTSEPSHVLQHFAFQDHTVPHQGPSRTPERPHNSFAHALPSSSTPNTHQPPSDSPPLSPAARRRLGMRLYMRKKRAEAAGKEPNLTPMKLTGGFPKRTVYVPKPRAKHYKKGKSHNSTQEPKRDDDAEEELHHLNQNSGLDSPSLDLEGEDGQTVAETIVKTLSDKGGITKPYKILSAFEDQGIDGHTLTESGFDIFNLPMIGKLMRLLQNAYTDPDEKSIASSVSSDTIKLMHDILIDFTSTVVHRAISMREQEVILKRKLKIWRLDKEDEITAGNVLDALQMHGLNCQNLLSDFPEEVKGGSPPVDNEPDDNFDETNEGVEQRCEEDLSLFYERLPAHREIVPPFVLLPRRLPDTFLLPAETNTDTLLAELDDESKLDKLDRQLEARYQKELWQASKAE